MKVWVTRDEGKGTSDCAVFKKKPHLEEDMWTTGMVRSLVFEMRVQYFKSLFGFTPRKGSCKQYELTLKEIT